MDNSALLVAPEDVGRCTDHTLLLLAQFRRDGMTEDDLDAARRHSKRAKKGPIDPVLRPGYWGLSCRFCRGRSQPGGAAGGGGGDDRSHRESGRYFPPTARALQSIASRMHGHFSRCPRCPPAVRAALGWTKGYHRPQGLPEGPGPFYVRVHKRIQAGEGGRTQGSREDEKALVERLEGLLERAKGMPVPRGGGGGGGGGGSARRPAPEAAASRKRPRQDNRKGPFEGEEYITEHRAPLFEPPREKKRVPKRTHRMSYGGFGEDRKPSAASGRYEDGSRSRDSGGKRKHDSGDGATTSARHRPAHASATSDSESEEEFPVGHRFRRVLHDGDTGESLGWHDGQVAFSRRNDGHRRVLYHRVGFVEDLTCDDLVAISKLEELAGGGEEEDGGRGEDGGGGA